LNSGNRLTSREWFELLSALAQTPSGATQRLVAQKLGLTKVEARRRLRSGVSAGLVVETVHHSLAQPGRRVFSLRHPEGAETLARLRAEQP
jgi:DNA-binding IclR family transcriptional regulator